MLRELNITNLALVSELHIEFSSGLVVLTGETGAGKSIILQAIHLLTGGKAAGSWVRTGAGQAVVEALFDVAPNHEIRTKLEDSGFACENDIIIKRILSAKGRSRFYINGSLATARLTGEICSDMVSVAGQHDHQQLLAPRYHLDFIDTVGDLHPLRRKITDIYALRRQKQERLENLQARERDREQKRDFLKFQTEEISRAQLVAGEDARLIEEKDRLKSSDELNSLGRKSYGLLHDTTTNSLAQVRKNLEQMAILDKSVAGLSEEIAGLSYQLDDQLPALRDYLDRIPSDPARLDIICNRIDQLQQLKRKYGPELDDVIVYGRQAEAELAELDGLEQNLEELNTELDRLDRKLLQKTEELSLKRKKIAHNVCRRLTGELKKLSLEHAAFIINFINDDEPPLKRLTALGIDRPEFFFSANPGEPPKPLAGVASGGELSRLMLALKCLPAGEDQVETIIFDEIDAGISGKAAESVARKIRELAGHHQVLCITHLPQIASGADEHFQVTKSVAEQRTTTSISRLDDDKIHLEIARMLDGDSATDKTLAYARELLSRNKSDSQ